MIKKIGINENYDKDVYVYKGGQAPRDVVNVVVEDRVRTIDYGAFSGCRKLKNITIPDSVTIIDAWAFNYCSSLKSITIPNSITSIGTCAFADCTDLTSVTIPSSVTSIGNQALSKEYIKTWWDDCASFYEYYKDNYGADAAAELNVFENASKFMFIMVLEGIEYIFSRVSVINENWDDEFELTADVIETILAEVDAFKSYDFAW